MGTITSSDLILKGQNVRKVFGSLTVLEGVNVEVHQGEVLAIIGPSGSGKSTLLRCFNGLEMPTDGIIEISGKPLSHNKRELAQQREQLGMVFQRFHLFPHLTVLGNIIEAPIHVKKVKKEKALELAYQLLDKIGLRDKANVYPSKLSGGQQQRVAIARALAMQPAVLLLDEPTSALDPELVGEVLQVIQKLAQEGMTMVLVTHEMAFARRVAGRVIFMADGKIVEEGPTSQLFENPQSERTRLFLRELTGQTI